MKYQYYPGCCMDNSSPHYETSTLGVAKVLGLELDEIEDWNCCGATSLFSFGELVPYTVAGRNLAIAERKPEELVACCSACYLTLSKTNKVLNEEPALKEKFDNVLAQAGLEYHGTAKVRHLLDVLVNDIGLSQIAAHVKNPLTGLKVAPYYGCQIVRPITAFDDPEFPVTMDHLLSALGADVTDFPYKTKCCGGAMLILDEDAVLDLSYKIIACAVDRGAEIIATPCPMCMVNLEALQKKMNQKYGKNYEIPVVFFTQLMALAFGLPESDTGFSKGMIPHEKVLNKYMKEVSMHA